MANEIKYFEDSEIYKIFVQKSIRENIVMVDKLISRNMPLLDGFYKAFPNYTLHNHTHQRNILRIIAELLGERVNELSSLEYAFILLSTVFHDIGMVFNEHELKEIQNEPDFIMFINRNYKAKLDFQDSGNVISKDLAEWYCRWTHAKRVWLFLKNTEDFNWGNISLVKELGHICESHNSDAINLIDDKVFDTKFLDDADLRFCAILLRLADILDFDSSRSPISVYEFLDLDNPKNKSEQFTKDEWQKHLCSNGFKFNHTENGIEILFTAGPKHPQIEKNIQDFLNVIEDELKASSSVIEKCSDKWRGFRIPLTINRENIKPQNYKQGEFSLSIDEGKILKLLTGENLYDNGFVFIRELLQNAIDTSRMREFHEKSIGSNDFVITPIEIKDWIDENGYRWIQFDDYGMGVNEYVILNHLLKKGSSYYKSDYFEIQKRTIKEKTGLDFTPISRFGIGLLSCFILGDRIEINTKSIKSNDLNEVEEIRLSIHGMQGQYMLQTSGNKDIPADMPDKTKGYRRDFGTSLAVRINSNKDYFDFEESIDYFINKFITSSPIPIIYNGNIIGVDFNQLMNTPLAVNKFYSFSVDDKTKIEEIIKIEIKSQIGVRVLPINLTKNSFNPKLKGQLVFFKLECEDFNEAFMRNWEYNFSTDSYGSTLKFKSKNFNTEKNNDDVGVSINISNIFETFFENDNVKKLFLTRISTSFHYKHGIQIIHNGVNVPNNFNNDYFSFDNSKLDFVDNLFSYSHNFPSRRANYESFGFIYLEDNLIPELSISRESIKSLNFDIYSSLYFATKELNSEIKIDSLKFNCLTIRNDKLNLLDVSNELLVSQKKWNDEKIFYTDAGKLSVNDIFIEITKSKLKVKISKSDNFLVLLTKALLEINFNCQYVIEGNESFFELLTKKDTYLESFTSPLNVVKFKDSNLLSHDGFINENHPLINLLYEYHSFLIENYETNYKRLINYIRLENPILINNILEYFSKIQCLTLKFGKIKVSEKDFVKKN